MNGWVAAGIVVVIFGVPAVLVRLPGADDTDARPSAPPPPVADDVPFESGRACSRRRRAVAARGRETGPRQRR